MENQITPFINAYNVHNIREQINMKKSPYPYLATIEQSAQVLTDYDTFPYPRWYRGVPQSSKPIVAEREAGWRPRHDDCYKVLDPKQESDKLYPDHCFETSCSLVVPCRPTYLNKLSDRKALNVILNKGCTIQYR